MTVFLETLICSATTAVTSPHSTLFDKPREMECLCEGLHHHHASLSTYSETLPRRTFTIFKGL
ncbi:hypothetical protein E2C01_035601 [Portunus trituberculatus]|uniref:Uncharacterized protein n=1 Tax=Portunus trituberculatus TaxID=210409 RepID=A0A5B7F9S8_PORTR|nr:hypothetical protein [Portunus trituberculatus]